MLNLDSAKDFQKTSSFMMAMAHWMPGSIPTQMWGGKGQAQNLLQSMLWLSYVEWIDRSMILQLSLT